jgi:hypothetical protein
MVLIPAFNNTEIPSYISPQLACIDHKLVDLLPSIQKFVIDAG